MGSNIKDWLSAWFTQHSNVDSGINEYSNLVEMGVLDSYKMILLIHDVESDYQINLDWDDFSNHETDPYTLDKLSRIISEKLSVTDNNVIR